MTPHITASNLYFGDTVLSLQTAASCSSFYLPQCQNRYPQVYPKPSSHPASRGSRVLPTFCFRSTLPKKACWIRRLHPDTPHKVQPPMEINKCPNRRLQALALGGGVLQTHHPCRASSTYSGFQTSAGISIDGSQSQGWHAARCRLSSLAPLTFPA